MEPSRGHHLDRLDAARRRLDRKTRRYHLAVAVQGLGVFLATIALMTVGVCLVRHYRLFEPVRDATVPLFDRIPDWQPLVHQAIDRWQVASWWARGSSYLAPALIAAVPFLVAALVRDGIARALRERILRLPRHQAVGFVIEAVAYRFRSAETRRFAVLLFASVGAFSAFLLVFTRPDDPVVRWVGGAWYLPVAAAIPVTFVVSGFALAWRRVLRRMRLTDSDVERFRLIRLVDAAVPLCTFALVVAVLLAAVPPVLRRAELHERRAQLEARQELDRFVVTQTPGDHPSRDDYAQLTWGRVDVEGADLPAWSPAYIGAAWRFFAGVLVALGGVFTTILFTSPTRPVEGASRFASAIRLWAVALASAGAVAVLWRWAGGWSAGAVALYVAGFALVFGALAWMKVWTALRSAQRVCPSCDRSFMELGETCPVCGVRQEVAGRVGSDEFVVGEGLATVHHRECRIYRSSSVRRMQRFMTLRQAIASVESEGNVARPCRVCLGTDRTWTGDPVWTSARRWAQWVDRELAS